MKRKIFKMPNAYKRNTNARLLWLYKNNIISNINYEKALKKIK